MTERNLRQDDRLADFAPREITLDGVTKRIHVACPHSVVTAPLVDEAGQPTLAARDEILAFFAKRLAPSR